MCVHSKAIPVCFHSSESQCVGEILLIQTLLVHEFKAPSEFWLHHRDLLGCHPRPGLGPARCRIPEPGPVTRDPKPGSSTHCVLDPGPGPARDPSSGPGRVTDDNQVMHHWRRRFPVIARFIVFFALIKKKLNKKLLYIH